MHTCVLIHEHIYKKGNLKSPNLQTKPVIVARILLEDYWKIIGMKALQGCYESYSVNHFKM